MSKMKTRLTLSFCLIIFSTCVAQNIWQVIFNQTVNPYSIEVSSTGNVFVVFQDSLIRSTDNGKSWEYLRFAITGACAFGASPTGSIYFYNFYDSLKKSTDDGSTWITLNLPKTSSLFQEYAPINTNSAGDIFVQLDNNPFWDTYRSTDDGNTWETIGPESSEMIDITFIGNLCIAIFVKPGIGTFLYRSFNNGDEWEIIPSSPTDIHTLFTAKNGKIYGGRVSGGNPPGILFISLDNGNTWQVINGFNPWGIFDIVENKLGHIFVATGEGVYRSTDEGDSWHLFSSGLNHVPTWKLAVDSLGYLYASSGLPQMLYGTVATTIPVELSSFTAKQDNFGVLLNWETVSELNNLGFEVERKTENGEWRTIGFKEGKGTTTKKQFYSFSDNSISNSTYYYRLKQIDFNGTFSYSEIVEVQVFFYTKFSLEQNYPNPFNPSTKIKFTVPYITRSEVDESLVTLKVYDVLGNEVATLVNEEKQSGTYEVEFNSTRTGRNQSLHCGIYFYQLRAGKFVETKKMALIK